MISYGLDFFYDILKNSKNIYRIDDDTLNTIDVINKQIVPINADKPEKNNKQSDFSQSNRRKKMHSRITTNADSWEDTRITFNAPSVKEEKVGMEKYLLEIRVALNKMSKKNYENQRDSILINLDKFINTCNEENINAQENIKKISELIFQIASTNKFFSDIYANLYKELISHNEVFQEILSAHITTYVSNIKFIEYSDPEDNYELYCNNNKQNDARKAMSVFLVNLMKLKMLPVLRILNIMVAFQTLVMEYIDEENKVNEVDEITEVLFLFLQEGKDYFDECKGEWIWKFVIKQNIETLAKCSKKDKKSLSSRAIFKYMDMVKFVNS